MIRTRLFLTCLLATLSLPPPTSHASPEADSEQVLPPDASHALSDEDVAAWRSRFRRGETAVIGNAFLQVRHASFAVKRNGLMQHVPVVRIEVVNIGNTRLAHATLEAQLYLPGRDGKAAPRDSSLHAPWFGPKPKGSEIFIGFGPEGLAPGERRAVEGAFTGFSERDWTSPDIVAAKKTQLVGRISRTYDGTREPIGLPGPDLGELAVR